MNQKGNIDSGASITMIDFAEYYQYVLQDVIDHFTGITVSAAFTNLLRI